MLVLPSNLRSSVFVLLESVADNPKINLCHDLIFVFLLLYHKPTQKSIWCFKFFRFLLKKQTRFCQTCAAWWLRIFKPIRSTVFIGSAVFHQFRSFLWLCLFDAHFIWLIRVLLDLIWFFRLVWIISIDTEKGRATICPAFSFFMFPVYWKAVPAHLFHRLFVDRKNCPLIRFKYWTDSTRTILYLIRIIRLFEGVGLFCQTIFICLLITVSQFYPGRRGTNGTAHADGTFPEHCGRFRP